MRNRTADQRKFKECTGISHASANQHTSCKRLKLPNLENTTWPPAVTIRSPVITAVWQVWGIPFRRKCFKHIKNCIWVWNFPTDRPMLIRQNEHDCLCCDLEVRCPVYREFWAMNRLTADNVFCARYVKRNVVAPYKISNPSLELTVLFICHEHVRHAVTTPKT